MASEPDDELSTPEKRPAPRSGATGGPRRRGRPPGTGRNQVKPCPTCGKPGQSGLICQECKEATSSDAPRAKRHRSSRCKAMVEQSGCEHPQAQPQSQPSRRRSTGPGRPPPPSVAVQQPPVAREARTKASHIALPTKDENGLVDIDPGLLQLAEPGGGHSLVQLTGQLPGKVDRIASWMQVYSSAGRSPHHGQPAYTSQDGNYLLYYSMENNSKGWWLGHVADGTTSSAALAFLPHGQRWWWVLERGKPREAHVIITAVPPPQMPQVAEEPLHRQPTPSRNARQRQVSKPPVKPNNFQPGAFWTYFGGKGVSLWQHQTQNQPQPQTNATDEICVETESCIVIASPSKDVRHEAKSQSSQTKSACETKSLPMTSRAELSDQQVQSPSKEAGLDGHSQPGTPPMTRDQISDKIKQMEEKLPRKLSSNVAWRPPRKSVCAKDIGLVLAPQVLAPPDTAFLNAADLAQQDILLRSLAKYTMLEPTRRRSSQKRPDLRNLAPDMRIAIGA